MQKFKDKKGSSYDIELTIGAVLRVKNASEGRINLLDSAAHAHVFATDELAFWEALWFLIEPQAKDQSISAADFGELMAAACLHEARRQFFKEWGDFFHQLHRPDGATVVETTLRHLNKAMELTLQRVAGEEMAEIDRLAEARMVASLNDSFGVLREQLELTPDRSPGES